MRRFVFSLLLVFPCFTKAEGGSGERLLVAARTSLLSDLFHQSISEGRSISEWVKGTFMSGTALTRGTLFARPFTSEFGLGLSLIFQSETDAMTLNTNRPRPDIGIAFDWTIHTPATTSKSFILRESGFALWPAQTAANSCITIHGLHTSASGPFSRLKNRIATKKAWETLLNTKAQNESEAALKIATELNKMVDQKTWDFLLPVHQKFLEYVSTPLVQKGLIGGRLGFGSNANWLVMRGTKSENILSVNPSQIDDLDSDSESHLIFRINEKLLERIAEMRLAGTLLTEVELAELFGRSPEQAETLAEVLGSEIEEVTFVFDEKLPLQVKFSDNRIRLTFRYRELTTLGKTLENITLSREIEILKNEAGSLFLKSRRPESPTYYDGKPLAPELSAHIVARMAQFLPKDATEISKNTFFDAKKSMRIGKFDASQGRLTVGLKAVGVR